MPRYRKRIRLLFKGKATSSKDNSGEHVETEDKGIKSTLLSGLRKILCAVQHWDPFPLRSHEVDDVNETNKYVLLSIISFLLCTNFMLIWISVFLIEARSRHDYASTDSFSSHILSFSAIILVICLICFGFSLSGFIGVFRENITLIRIFYVALIVLLVMKLSIALFTFSFTGTAEHIVGSILGDKLILNYRVSTDIEATMDYLHVSFRCCGLQEQGFKDWGRSIYFNCSDDNPSTERCSVPWSCCRNETGLNNALCGRNVQKLDRNFASRTIYTKGCINAILEWARNHAFLVASLLLLETILLTVLIFQCTHLVNELQMMNREYRGPWWIWVGERRQDERPSHAKDTQYGDERPMAELPFHLELAWHETLAPVGQQSPAVFQQRTPPTVPADQPSPSVDQRRTPSTSVPATSARHQQRRSTVGQRFFRAVMSRASRVANRRQAVAAEEEARRRGVAGAVEEGQQGTEEGWLVHHRTRDAGSMGPAGAASHALQFVGEDSKLEAVEVDISQKSPLPPISEPAEVQEVTEIKQVKQIEQSHDPSLGKTRKNDIWHTNSFAKKQQSSVSSGAAPPLPGFIVSENQINLPSIHSQQGSSEQLLEIVPKFSDQKHNDMVSPAQSPDKGTATFRQPPSNELVAEDHPGGVLEVKKGDSKSSATSVIALVLDAVENGVSRTFSGEGKSASPQQETSSPNQEPEDSPTEPVSAVTDVAQRQPSVSVTTVMPSYADVQQLETGSAPSAVDVSLHPTVSVAGPAQENDGDVPQYTAVGGEVHQGAAVDGDTAELSPLPVEELQTGYDDDTIASSAHGQHRRRATSDASTGTHSEKRERKHHHRRSKPHKKKRKKRHTLLAEETDSIGKSDAENELVPEWLKPTLPETSDGQDTRESTGSAYFSPSEFQHLAVQQSPNSTDNNADDQKSQRRGSVARAVSRKLHEILPGLNPASAAQSQRHTSGKDDEHLSVARAVSKKLQAILPSFGLKSEESLETKPSTSRAPIRMMSPETVEVPQELPRLLSTFRDAGAPERVSPPASPEQPQRTESDTDREW